MDSSARIARTTAEPQQARISYDAWRKKHLRRFWRRTLIVWVTVATAAWVAHAVAPAATG